MPITKRLKSKRSKRVKKNNRVTKKYRRHTKLKLSRHNKIKNKRIMRGGYGPGAGPVGYSWSPNPSSWPGVYASTGGNTNGTTTSNYYSYNSDGTGVGGSDPAISTRGDLANLNIQKGGYFPFSQDIINMGRQALYFGKDTVNGFFGPANEATNPSPTSQSQLSLQNPEIIEHKSIDVEKYVQDATTEVAGIK
jgi:hypothetical protein